MKQIFCVFMTLLVVFGFLACSAPKKKEVGQQRVFRITHADSAGRMFSEIWTAPKLETLGMRKISSEYFDRATHMSDSRFSVISFSKLLTEFALKRGEDAVLLNCFDDYQGILSLDDVYRYDLRLATKIMLASGSSKPNWLNPLLILVPDGQQPPFQERFMTANIRELKLVRLNDYYAPLEKNAGSSPKAQEGLEVFKNNCLFCHSLKGRGGNKGARLLDAYDFSYKSDQIRMLVDFRGFHNKDNQDKQDVEQFITQKKLERVVDFLKSFDDLKN
ncbi:c-type cytochrome [Nitrospinae bacterium]|nr:c-type cytochrome [Nitrospinota bacterium]